MKLEFKIKKKAGNFMLEEEYAGDAGVLGILGASGCGKSMTLRMIAGIETPDCGYIRVDGCTLFDSEKKINVKPRDRGIGYLFQNYALFPNMTVEENIGFALKEKGEERNRIIREMVKSYRLEGLEKNLPHQLSGGQQQRAALARMMALRPRVILLDEPFSALDVYLKDQMIREMEEMLRGFEGLALLVSHSRDEIYRLCPQTIVMNEGCIIRHGGTEEIFEDPQFIQAAVLTGCKNIIEAEREDEHTLFLPLWNAHIHTARRVPEEVRAVGIRAHYFEPVWDAASYVNHGEGDCVNQKVRSYVNLIEVEEAYRADLQFERQYYLDPVNDSTEGAEQLRWFVQMDMARIIDEKGMPRFLHIPEDAVMFLGS